MPPLLVCVALVHARRTLSVSVPTAAGLEELRARGIGFAQKAHGAGGKGARYCMLQLMRGLRGAPLSAAMALEALKLSICTNVARGAGNRAPHTTSTALTSW